MSAYTILAIILISIMAVLFAFPLYWIITGSFKTGAAINATTPEWWPSQWVLTNYQKLFCRQECPAVAAGRALRQASSAPTVSPSTSRSAPRLPPPLRWMINTVFMAVMSMILHLHHRRHGRLCAGQKALCGPQAAVHPHRLRHGSAQAGHPDPPAARDERTEPVQHHLGRHLPHRGLALRRVPDEAVQ